MTDRLVNWLLVKMARAMRISPGLAQVLILVAMTIAIQFSEHTRFRSTRPDEIGIWLAICALVVLITWLTKGEHRKLWWRARPWQIPPK